MTSDRLYMHSAYFIALAAFNHSVGHVKLSILCGFVGTGLGIASIFRRASDENAKP